MHEKFKNLPVKESTYDVVRTVVLLMGAKSFDACLCELVRSYICFSNCPAFTHDFEGIEEVIGHATPQPQAEKACRELLQAQRSTPCQDYQGEALKLMMDNRIDSLMQNCVR